MTENKSRESKEKIVPPQPQADNATAPHELEHKAEYSLGEMKEEKKEEPEPVVDMPSIDAQSVEVPAANVEQPPAIPPRPGSFSSKSAVASAISSSQDHAMEELALRRQHLERAKQLVYASRDEEDRFWVRHAQYFRDMVARMQAASQTVSELRSVLLVRAKAMQLYYDTISKQGSFGATEAGTLRRAAVGLDLLCRAGAEQHEGLKERVFTVITDNCLQLSKDVARRAAYLKSTGETSISELFQARERAAQAWSAYEKGLTECLRVEMSGKGPKEDPVLLSRMFQYESLQLRRAERKHSKTMVRLLNELKLADGRRIDAMKAMLVDFLLGEKTLMANTIKLLDGTLDSVKTVDREADVQAFIRQAGLHENDKGLTVFDEPPPMPDMTQVSQMIAKEVIAAGDICRQGSIISSNWKQVYAIITKSGFFHYFEGREALKPSLSLLIRQATISRCPAIGPACLELAVPSSSIFSLTSSPTKYVYKFQSEENMQSWLRAFSRFAKVADK